MTRSSKPPVAVYSALADATRCRIIEILLAGPIPVHRLADAFTISRPAISRHLRVLKSAGLVAEVKKGRENLYALRTAKLGPAVAWIEKVAARPGAKAEPEVADAPVAATPPVLHAPPVTPVANADELSISGKPVTPRQIRVTKSKDAEQGAVAPQVQPKADKAPRVSKAEPPVNQMGFDF